MDDKINNLCYNNTLVVPPLDNVSSLNNNTRTIKCKVDSGATNTYIRSIDKSLLNNIQAENKHRTIILPNNKRVMINEVGTLNTTANLSSTAKQASVVPDLKSASLLSVGNLCDDGCKVNFDDKKLQVI